MSTASDAASFQQAQRFRPEVKSVGAARRFVLSTLEFWGLDTDDAGLMVSELATNAVVHARTDYTVAVRVMHDAVRVMVTDENPREPILPVVPSGATSGFGLTLVSRLARAWGVDSHPDGKIVFFDIPCQWLSQQPQG